jgi:hypothetical protein
MGVMQSPTLQKQWGLLQEGYTELEPAVLNVGDVTSSLEVLDANIILRNYLREEWSGPRSPGVPRRMYCEAWGLSKLPQPTALTWLIAT